MILDNLNQWRRYAPLSPRLLTAFNFLETVDGSWKPGRYDIDGTLVYALAQKYTTHSVETAQAEAHRKYIDVQYVLSGREVILWAPLASLTRVTMPYTEEKDAALFELIPTAT